MHFYSKESQPRPGLHAPGRAQQQGEGGGPSLLLSTGEACLVLYPVLGIPEENIHEHTGKPHGLE